MNANIYAKRGHGVGDGDSAGDGDGDDVDVGLNTRKQWHIKCGGNQPVDQNASDLMRDHRLQTTEYVRYVRTRLVSVANFADKFSGSWRFICSRGNNQLR